MSTKSRAPFFFVPWAFAFLALARPVPASADGTNILDTIDRIPEGIFDGNPHAWQGVFAPGAQIVDDLVAPFLFDPPGGTAGWAGEAPNRSHPGGSIAPIRAFRNGSVRSGSRTLRIRAERRDATRNRR
jgi:hypothetical protein